MDTYRPKHILCTVNSSKHKGDGMTDVDISGATRLATGPVSDLWEFVKGQTADWSTKLSADCLASALSEEICRISHVKTIWRFDEPTPLSDFFYPPTVLFQNMRTSIEHLGNKKYEKPFVIEGTAGQGKSVLLRQIAANEYEARRKIPIFLELRKIGSSSTLLDRVYKWFGDFGISDGKVAFTHLAQSGSISLLLDGFDELKEAQIESTLEQLEKITKRNPKLRVVVTSRPGTAVVRESGFLIARIQKLGEKDVYGVLTKLLGQCDQLNKMLDALEKRQDILPVLTTPISVALLSFVYQGTQSIPETLWEFYDEIFPLMFERIDQMKPGFSRERECNLDKSQMRRAFDKLAFFLHHNSCLTSSEDNFVRYSEEALAGLGQTVSAQSFINDIVSVTCLLVRDGTQLSILHRTIAEFHCARFLAKLPDITAIKVYSMLLDTGKWHDWENVVSFLMDLDPIRVRQLYLIPEIESALGPDASDGHVSPLDTDKMQKLIASKIDEQLSMGRTAEVAVKRSLDRGRTHRLMFSAFCYEANELFKQLRRKDIPVEDFDYIMRREAELLKVKARGVYRELEEHRRVVREHHGLTQREHEDVVRMVNDVSIV